MCGTTGAVALCHMSGMHNACWDAAKRSIVVLLILDCRMAGQNFLQVGAWGPHLAHRGIETRCCTAAPRCWQRHAFGRGVSISGSRHC